MEGMDFDLPDAEEIATDLDRAAVAMAQKGAYGWATACELAAKRIRTDDEALTALAGKSEFVRREQRRYEIARDVMAFNYSTSCLPFARQAANAVEAADALLAALEAK